jgi:hypothetical protein
MHGGGGGGWVVGGWGVGNTLQYITYDPITIELWIELYALQSYQFTSYQFHRIGDTHENLCWIITGTISQNHNSWIQLMHGDDMHFLHFQEGVVAPNVDDPPVNLPITWETRYGNGLVPDQNILVDWVPAPWSSPDDIGYRIPRCDHWFEFRGCIGDIYHVHDGYYNLHLAGCPAPEL